MTLRWARLMRQLTQQQVMEATGIFQSRLSLLETGRVRPTSAEREKLVRALKISAT
jgi:transcriptional regulator with XRE-family HTH domain